MFTLKNKNWWKAPILQGDDNDYGEYDYLIEELPEDRAEWSTFPCKCDTCGKERRLNYVATTHFHTLDGWDSMDYCSCWVCELKSAIIRKKKSVKANFEDKRWHFFAYNKVGQKISEYACNKYCEAEKNGTLTKFTKWFAGVTIPF